MVNRIHPDTHRAWNRWHDMVVTQEVLRAEERAHGLRSVSGRLAAHGLATDRTGPDGRAHAHNSTLARPNGPSLIERARAQLADWREARSWSDLATRLDAVGLWVEARIRGAVVTDGEHYVRASRVAPDCSGPALAARFGQSLPATPDVESDAPRRVRAALDRYGSVVDADTAVYSAEAWAAAARHRRDVLDAVRMRADESWQVFDRALASVFPDSDRASRARAEFIRAARYGTTASLAADMTQRAEAGGRRTPGMRGILPHVRSHERDALHGRVATAVDAGTRALAAERALETTAREMRRARFEREPGRPGVAGAASGSPPDRAGDQDLRRAFAGMYASPDRALDRFQSIEAARGGPHAIRILFDDPEQLGRMRGGPASRARGGDIHAHAVALAQSYLAGTGRSQSELEVARTEVVEAERAVTAGLARQRTAPNRDAALAGVRRVMADMAALELAGVRALLTVPERVLLRSVRQAAREVALGRSSDVER